MTIQTINLGGYANDGTGDDLRTAFTKVNANFAFLNTEITVGGATNLGSGTGIFADKNATNLEFKSLTSTSNSVTITNTNNTVNLEAVTTVQNDTTPALGGNLNMNGNYIYGGDTQTTVFGLSIPLIDSFISASLETGAISLDLGTFPRPTGFDATISGFEFDFGSFLAPTNNTFNFGVIV